MRRRTPIADLLRRLLAAGGAALVLALTVFAASPELHGLLHTDDGASHEEACAVTLFASGVSVPLTTIAVVAPEAAWPEPAPAAAEEIFVSSPRYLRQPERGPPVV
jgi:hypothetical protein